MRLKTSIISATGIALLVPLAGSVTASEDDRVRHGRDLMSTRELAHHRTTMHRLSPQQREAYRAAHHEVMEERAADQGVTLPDEPMARGHGRRLAGAVPGPCLRDDGYEALHGYHHHGNGYIDD